jgi:hypothetical protein
MGTCPTRIWFSYCSYGWYGQLDVDMLSSNPSSSKEDTIKAQWHGDMDLEVYQDGIRLHTCVFYWDVPNKYFKWQWVVGIPRWGPWTKG